PAAEPAGGMAGTPVGLMTYGRSYVSDVGPSCRNAAIPPRHDSPDLPSRSPPATTLLPCNCCRLPPKPSAPSLQLLKPLTYLMTRAASNLSGLVAPELSCTARRRRLPPESSRLFAGSGTGNVLQHMPALPSLLPPPV
ncbi:hypothetical protein Vafri_14197, partial [Volvox africanus]